MPIEYSHKCTRCGYSVITCGPWEFYRNSGGKRKQYGHPAPLSLEAARAGIWGYSATVYCPNCDRVFDVILKEYKKPYYKDREKGVFIKHPLIFNILPGFMKRTLFKKPELPELKDEYKKEGAVKCPKCGNTNLVRPDEDNIRIVTCPRCKEGKLIPKRGWVSK